MTRPEDNAVTDAQSAIDKAFGYFDAYVQRAGTVSNVLLEMLKYDEERDRWGIGIGYDLGRQRVVTEGSAALGNKIAEPIRELRSIWIDGKDGRLLEIG